MRQSQQKSSVFLCFSSAEMFRKPLWQTVWTQIRLIIVCSGSTLFASILNSSVLLGNYLKQTTSQMHLVLGALRVNVTIMSYVKLQNIFINTDLQIRVCKWKIIFLISQPKLMLRVLKRTVSIWGVFWAPKTHCLNWWVRKSLQFYV